MSSIPPANLVFEDDALEVLHLPGQGPYLLVTFSELTTNANGRNFWAESYARKTGTPALGFVAKQPNWFPAASVEQAIASLAPLFSNYPERVVYGHSMGGYAALRYGAALGAGTALAFCPQITIDLRETHGWDDRYASYFSQARNGDMKVRAAHLSDKTYVFYDPFYAEDRNQVNLLGNATNLSHAKVSMTGHDTVRLFADSEVMSSLIRLCNASHIQAIHQLVRQRRKAHQDWIAFSIAKFSVSRREAIASNILKKYMDILSASQQAEILELIATKRADEENYSESEALLRRAFDLSNGTRPLTMWRLSDLYKRRGDVNKQLSWAKQAAANGAAGAHIYVAGLLLQHDRLDEAAAEARLALEREPRNAKAITLCSQIYERQGDDVAAMVFAEWAATQEAGDTVLQDRATTLRERLLQAGRPAA